VIYINILREDDKRRNMRKETVVPQRIYRFYFDIEKNNRSKCLVENNTILNPRTNRKRAQNLNFRAFACI